MTSLDDFALTKPDRSATRSVKWTLTETDRLVALEVIESKRVAGALSLHRAWLAEALSGLIPAAT